MMGMVGARGLEPTRRPYLGSSQSRTFRAVSTRRGDRLVVSPGRQTPQPKD